jgi:hypothetical protein
MDYYKPKAAIRTSLARYARCGKLLDIPLYLIGRFPAIFAHDKCMETKRPDPNTDSSIRKGAVRKLAF